MPFAQVDTQREVVLVPIYGVMVPFHILTIKNATNNQARPDSESPRLHRAVESTARHLIFSRPHATCFSMSLSRSLHLRGSQSCSL